MGKLKNDIQMVFFYQSASQLVFSFLHFVFFVSLRKKKQNIKHKRVKNIQTFNIFYQDFFKMKNQNCR